MVPPQGAMVPPPGLPPVPGGAAQLPAAAAAGVSPWMSLLAVLGLGGVVTLVLVARQRGRGATPPQA